MSFRGAAKKPSEGDFVNSITASPDVRLYLIYGQDESMIADMAAQMAAKMGTDAERIDLDSDKIRNDPALLADEACSLSLFGGTRYIRLNMRREEGHAAFENLLNAPNGGCPVIATAGDYKKTSKLVKLVDASKFAKSFICYAPDEGSAASVIMTLAGTMGLRLERALALRISRYTGQDRKLAALEIEKLALYYDAAPDRPAKVEIAAFEALSAETGEENVQDLVNQVMSGNVKKLGAELVISRQMGVDAIRIVRAMQRRAVMLAGLRGQINGNTSPAELVERTRSIFWKERKDFIDQLGRWQSSRLAGLNGHLMDIEARLMSVKAEVGIVILEQELTKIARAAARAG
jgi:DNA polymerase III subunit delta